MDTQKKQPSQSDSARATVLWNLFFNKKLTDDFISPEQLQTLRTTLYKEWPPDLQAKLKPYGAEMIAEPSPS